jgi:hypothetical protein
LQDLALLLIATRAATREGDDANQGEEKGKTGN